jgi:hypothetical protein
MKFKEPFIKQIIWEIRFEPILNYHQKRIEICEKFREKLSYWSLDIKKIDMHDQPEKRESQRVFSFLNRAASLVIKDIEDYDNFKSLSILLLENIISGLEIKNIIRFGIRFFYYIESENSFEQLRNLMIKKLYNNEFIRDLEIEKQVLDLGYVIDFNKQNTKFHMTLGPISKKEIEERFDIKEPRILEAALLFDLDCFLENSDSSIIKDFINTSYKSSRDILEKIVNYLQGE